MLAELMVNCGVEVMTTILDNTMGDVGDMCFSGKDGNRYHEGRGYGNARDVDNAAAVFNAMPKRFVNPRSPHHILCNCCARLCSENRFLCSVSYDAPAYALRRIVHVEPDTLSIVC